jgi:tape measure domain-containing protein
MATIKTAIQVYDGMSPAFRSMNKAMNIVLNSFEAIQSASHNAIDTNSIQTARQELAKAESTFNSIEQEIKDADTQQKKFNDDIRNGQNAASGMHGAITKIIATVAAYVGITKTFDLADQLTSTKARLDLMNDGLQTSIELQNMIYASAQRSRTSYLDTAAVVSKLGILAKDAFSNNREMVVFAEQMNKQFKIGGASVQEQTSAMYQLTQAMASGKLQGDEFRAIMENAPLLAQAIAKYTGKSVGELRQMSAEGTITADIIKNAMFASIDETNKKFETLPLTWGQVWASIQNKAIKAFEPILNKISEITNNPNFQKFTTSVIGTMVIAANIVIGIFNMITSIAGFLYDNWSWISPIIWGVVAAMIAYNAIALITNGILAVQGIQAAIVGAAQMMQTGATFSATAAQWGLNAALYACPLTWIILLIIGLIALFYLVIGAINKFAGTSISATGIIAGVFSTLGTYIYNVFAYAWNYIASFVEFFANVFTNPVYSIKRLFVNLFTNLLDFIITIASAIDKVFGSKLSTGLTDLKNNMQSWIAEKPENYKVVKRLEMKNLDEGFSAGYDFGKNIKFDTFALGNSLDGINNGVNNTALNTASMANTMNKSEEELKYMRDLAEQEVINRFTTAEIKIDMGGINNNVSQNADLDEMVTYLEEKLYETMQVAAEGVHS